MKEMFSSRKYRLSVMTLFMLSTIYLVGCMFNFPIVLDKYELLIEGLLGVNLLYMTGNVSSKYFQGNKDGSSNTNSTSTNG